MRDPLFPPSMRAALATLLCVTAMVMPAIVRAAGDDHGHDHGAEPAAAGAASPRFEAHSDLFELVGVVDKGQLTIYLDRFATNEPVPNAKIEFESGTQKGLSAPQPDGTYAIKFGGLEKPGQFPFSFTVSAGSDTDLLAGELVIPDANANPEEDAGSWRRWLAVGMAAFAVLALMAFVARRLALRRSGREFA